MQLSFIQSNWLRQYPFREGQGIIDLNNNTLPTNLLVGVKITCAAADLEVWISKIWTSNGNVSIAFSGSNGDIGYANGSVTDDNQSIVINNYVDNPIGSVLIGDYEATLPTQTFLFSNTTGLIEPSTVIVMPVPGLTSITVKGVKYTGRLAFISSTLNITAGSSIGVSVKNSSVIESRGDKCSGNLTCDNKIISGINNVLPDGSGNIDIYAIAPLQLSIATINGRAQQILLSAPSLGMSESVPNWVVGSTPVSNICKLVNIPPVNTSDTYGTTVSTITPATLPEWAGWSQYL